jgi:hypothetical protein
MVNKIKTVHQCFKGDKVTRGELGTPGRLGDKAWLLPKASSVSLEGDAFRTMPYTSNEMYFLLEKQEMDNG